MAVSDSLCVEHETVVRGELPNTFYVRTGKRIFELCITLILLLLCAPLVILFILAFWLTEFFRKIGLARKARYALNGYTRLFGAIFVHTRVKEGDTTFPLFKLTSLAAYSSKEKGAPVELHRTFLGRFVRRFRIDELPQLVNILRGEMNLIGPRPMSLQEFRILGKRFPEITRRHAIAGGITGLSQVTLGRPENETQEREKVQIDLYYIEHVSLRLDLWILCKTPWVVLSGFGAR